MMLNLCSDVHRHFPIVSKWSYTRPHITTQINHLNVGTVARFVGAFCFDKETINTLQ